MKPTIKNIQPYIAEAPVQAIQQAYHLDHIARLSANENVYGASPKVYEALQQLNQDVLNYYPDGNANDLRQALSQLTGIAAEKFLFGNGADELISLISRVFLTSDSNIVIQAPTFGAYRTEANIEGAEVRAIPVFEQNGHTDFSGMLNAIDEKTSLVWLVNPNNPTGVFEPVTDIENFLNQLPPDVVLVVDEAYYDFVNNQTATALPLLENHDNLIVVRTLSKAYGLANLRIGWLATNAAIHRDINAIRAPYNLSSYQIAGGVAAIEDQDYLQKVVAGIQDERTKWLAVLDSLNVPYYVSDTNFLWFKVADAKRLGEQLLSQGVQVNSRLNPQWIRIAIGLPEDNLLAQKITSKYIHTAAQ